MKTFTSKTQLTMTSLATGLFLLAFPLSAGDMTAFDLVKEGNQYVGVQSKDKVVQIRSEKSIGTLTPDIWRVVYYDPDAPLKAVEVKFGAGKKLDVKRPARILEPLTKAQDPLPKEQLKVDSDEAFKIASKEPLLENLKLKATRLTLERRSSDDSSPVWKVELWAAKLKNPNDNIDIGDVLISADTGTVLKSDLKPKNVD
jgi:hypothetical protein